jgi:hypothetical protein
MAEEQSSLHIDTDWKKQAQEEKKRLAEKAQQAKDAAPATAPAAGGAATPGAAEPRAASRGRAGARGGAAGQRELPPASIATLAQSLMTQALYYLGELAYQGGDPVAGLDMAKHNLDTLAVLEEKTANNLTDEERHALDLALYEARSRFVSVASQFV